MLAIYRTLSLQVITICLKPEQEMNSYLDFLLSEVDTMTENQLPMLLWEPIIEYSNTTLISTEWALFELAKDPAR